MLSLVCIFASRKSNSRPRLGIELRVNRMTAQSCKTNQDPTLRLITLSQGSCYGVPICRYVVSHWQRLSNYAVRHKVVTDHFTLRFDEELIGKVEHNT